MKMKDDLISEAELELFAEYGNSRDKTLLDKVKAKYDSYKSGITIDPSEEEEQKAKKVPKKRVKKLNRNKGLGKFFSCSKSE